MSFISCRIVHIDCLIFVISDNLFHVGRPPIEMIMQTVLCEQAPSHRMHNHFCMAELLHKKKSAC